MDYNKPFNFLKKLPPKLNSFYKTKSKFGLVVSNKSKSKKDFDPVTNFDRAFEKYIRSLINKKFPKDSIIEEEFEDIDVPFAVIEDVPIFPGCESVAKSQRRACFQDKINQHIRRNFRYPEIAQEMGIQGRVYVNFIIAKDGSITNIRMRGPDKNLENEAQRIISRLPQMTPGKQRGRAVRVPFSIPITFRLQ